MRYIPSQLSTRLITELHKSKTTVLATLDSLRWSRPIAHFTYVAVLPTYESVYSCLNKISSALSKSSWKKLMRMKLAIYSWGIADVMRIQREGKFFRILIQLCANTARQGRVQNEQFLIRFTDSLVERNHRMLGFENAKYRHISSLQSWLEGNGCIARAETAYLQQGEDLVTLTSTSDNALDQLEAWIEHAMIWISKNSRIVRNHPSFR